MIDIKYLCLCHSHLYSLLKSDNHFTAGIIACQLGLIPLHYYFESSGFVQAVVFLYLRVQVVPYQYEFLARMHAILAIAFGHAFILCTSFVYQYQYFPKPLWSQVLFFCSAYTYEQHFVLCTYIVVPVIVFVQCTYFLLYMVLYLSYVHKL